VEGFENPIDRLCHRQWHARNQRRHRIGRTGRAQTVGEAFTIMTAEELPHVLDIERFIGQKVTRKKLENFTYVYTALFDEDRVMSSLKGAKGVRTHKGMRFGAKRRR
jgi:ATP-dependent RNA helicase RhlE